MLKTVKSLINKSKSLPASEKDKYLRIVKFLPDDEVERLIGILSREEGKIDEIGKGIASKKSDLNREYLEKLENLYKKEYERMEGKEEEEEKEKADELLKQLDD